MQNILVDGPVVSLSPTEQLIRNSSPCENWMVDVAYHLINHPVIGKLCNIRVDKDDAGTMTWMSMFDKNNFKKGKDNFFKYNGKEDTPSGYEDTVDAYFKSLAEGEE